MLSNRVLVWGEVNAVDLILGDITVKPLNLWPHLLQRLQGVQGHFPYLRLGQCSGTGDLAFNHVLRHNFKSLTPTHVPVHPQPQVTLFWDFFAGSSGWQG